MRLEGKVALVTGAAHGIGRAIARRFSAEGAHVVVNDINKKGGEFVKQEIVESGARASAIPADVSSKSQVDAMFDQVFDQLGGLHILVNNAGLISPMLHFLDENADEKWWQKIINVNLTGTYLCAHRAAHHMARNGGGVIINMSSGGASRAHRGFAAYDASKGGIEALTRAMALDLGPYGIRVNTLVPGSIDTSDMTSESREKRGENIPLGRVGEPEEMAGPAVFLASDDASYVTGHVLTVDGGMLSQQRSATADIFPLSKYPKLL
ncbi:MAG: glucose 1-dehydrogenase [SAR324 cluster bacterium]|nr:glucose 1-dehydrogenase [SAR324 cluster bacterium]